MAVKVIGGEQPLITLSGKFPVTFPVFQEAYRKGVIFGSALEFKLDQVPYFYAHLRAGRFRLQLDVQRKTCVKTAAAASGTRSVRRLWVPKLHAG